MKQRESVQSMTLNKQKLTNLKTIRKVLFPSLIILRIIQNKNAFSKNLITRMNKITLTNVM